MSEPQATDHSRRQFLDVTAQRCVAAAGCLLGASLLGACASVVARRVPAIDGRVHLTIAQYPELSEVGGSLRIQPSGMSDPLYILVLAPAQYSVLSPICTHLGCTVEITGDRMVCPCHGSTYDREGKVLRGPAERPLRRLGASVTSDGVLVINLSAAT